MGKPGGAPARNAPGTSIGLRNGQRVKLTQPGERIDPPAHISRPEALDAWEEYWLDPVSSVVTQADHQMMYRWIDMVERYFKLIQEADTEPIIVTLNNGQTANPLYKVALGIQNQIERLEARLGIGPKNRAALGVQIFEAEKGKRQLSAMDTPSGHSGGTADVEDEDPRLAG